MKQFNKEFSVGESAIKKASKVLMEYYRKSKQNTFHQKSEHDLVTAADLAAEKVMIDLIKKKFPEHSILSEEAGSIKGDESRWIMDPLDGTHNFAFGLPVWGTMLAFEHAGKIQFSIISLPVYKETYCAVKSKGSTLNGKKISVSDRTEKFMSFLDMKSFRNPDHKDVMEKFLTKYYRKLRSMGSIAASGCFIASGRAEVILAMNTTPWDIAPTAFLVEEAGGRVTDFAGDPWKPFHGSYLISNGKIHEAVLNTLK